MKKLLLALQFLTIVPLRGPGQMKDREVGSTTALFPVVGAIEGTLLVAAAVIFLRLFSGDVTCGFLVLALVVLNGGLHLDGLADTFDAIASRASRKEKLAVMKDSATGAAGVTAIVFALLLKYLMLYSLFVSSERIIFYSLLFLMPVVSRWIVVSAIYYGKSARQDGLGKVFIDHTGGKDMLVATAFLFAVMATVLISIPDLSLFVAQSVYVFPVLYVFSRAAVWFFNRQFNGLTGDSFGAAHEVGTLLFLMINLAVKKLSG